MNSFGNFAVKKTNLPHMKLQLISAFLIAALWACANTAGPMVVEGEQIYKIYCVNCHGIQGNMGASGAHDLSASQLPLNDRIAVITNGRNAMTPFKSLLSKQQIKAVAEYTLSLNPALAK